MQVSDTSKKQLKEEIESRISKESFDKLYKLCIDISLGTSGISVPPFVPALFKIDTMGIVIESLKKVLKELEDARNNTTG